MAEDNEELGVGGPTDSPVSNLLEKGRYRFVVKEIRKHTSDAGNECALVVFDAEGVRITEFLMLQGQMSYKWRQFLYAVGIRDKRKSWKVSPDLIVGKEGLVDVGQKPSYRDPDLLENYACSFSPIKEETAPVKGVEPEEKPSKEEKKEEDKPKKEEEKSKSEPEEEDDL